MENGREPISEDEILYRRVPVSLNYYDASTGALSSEAFAPNKNRDTTGISVFRAKYKSLEQAALGHPGKSYFVARLIAKDIFNAGMTVEPRPDLHSGYDPAHAEIPELNSLNRKTSETLERQRILATIRQAVEGPYLTPGE